MSLREKISPALVLFFLAPATGELLSGSSPPLEFFNPIILLLLCLMYGCGVILVREAIFRWRKGWLSMLMLGAAYGIAEEALAVKSFFDPHWVDIGVLGSYGRWGGVNWIWSLELTAFHAVISISVPIILVTMLFYRKRTESWVSDRGVYYAWAGFLFIIAFCFLLLTPYKPPTAQYILAALVATALVYGAWRLPHPFPWEMFLGGAGRQNGTASVRWFSAFGLSWTFGLFFFSWIAVWLAPAIVTGLLMISFFLLSGLLLAKKSGQGRKWDEARQCGLASGALGFFLGLAPILELAPGRWPNNNSGMTAAAIAMLLFLVWLNRRVSNRYTSGVPMDRGASPAPPQDAARPISPRNMPPPN
jgi:hypothetical protein